MISILEPDWKEVARGICTAGISGLKLAAVKGEKTLAELAQQYDVHPNLINQWRARLLEGAADVFCAEPAAAERRST